MITPTDICGQKLACTAWSGNRRSIPEIAGTLRLHRYLHDVPAVHRLNYPAESRSGKGLSPHRVTISVFRDAAQSVRLGRHFSYDRYRTVTDRP